MGTLSFLDTEFTSLVTPELLSLGLVTLDGCEHYVELDLSTEVGQARKRASSDFVRYDGVLDLWGLVPGAPCDYPEMGRRTAEWLLGLAAQSGTPVQVAFDYWADFELMERAIHDLSLGLWERVRAVVTPVDVGALTGSPEGEIAAEECFHELRRLGLARHHALADANALRAAYIAVKAVAVQMAHATHSDIFRQLAQHALQLGLDEAWLQRWLRAPAFELGGRLPKDMLEEPGGLEALKDLLGRIAHGVYS
ncbi:DUF2384 domain-containing protein [Ideonella sp. B7]|uniref:MbcA/ParS/Xre antitoxin family protein n=1 Tax=Ideonella benzenivorans TaxID=2831643 RepID=UPI001CEDC5B1|nr:MbcA/ParS/Xre antitoxin family protein [Ideonella benzenivorans]MCA6218929.1 DUF2384 domain-containing protein [Ideonella benzenivorans]